jgi:2-(1,2-epoxy-1,2-dihydrophenyl)acetyl-CoA isomerase
LRANHHERIVGMSYETVIWEQAGGVGRLTLNRPESMNAWTEQLGRDLGAVISGEAAEAAVRAVLITGAGRGFSSGADLKRVPQPAADGMPDLEHELRDIYHPVITGIRALPKPVVAAINGAAVGIGVSLALACDLLVAAESAFLGLSFVNIGLMPDGGSTVFVPPAVGKARAFQLALLGERVPAAQALEWGLVNWVYPDDEMLAAAENLVTRLAGGPTLAYAAAKEALNSSVYWNLDSQLEIEARLQHRLARTKDFQEGVMAFATKREPAFTGS